MNVQSFKNILGFTISAISAVECRQCYNYDKDPSVEECSHGCCGDEYKQYCCNPTFQIIGCVLGGLAVIAIIAGAAYYCYRKKSKGRHAASSNSGGGGILGRLGMRSNQSSQPRQVHQRPSHRVGMTNNMTTGRYNPAYVNAVNIPGHGPGGYVFPANTEMHGPPVAPTAPMPPPYSMCLTMPPPYDPTKSALAPPEYNSIVGVGQPAYPPGKFGEYRDSMPPPGS